MSPSPLPPPPLRPSGRPVLLYDGACGLCQQIVVLLLRADAVGRLHYAALQSAPGQAYLRAQGLPTEDFDSIVFVPDWNRPGAGAYQLRTDGIAAALALLDRPWRWLAVFRQVPRPWRDAAYRFVARSRHSLFGRRPPAPLSRPEWERRFLAR